MAFNRVVQHINSTQSSNTVFEVVAKNTVLLVSGDAQVYPALEMAVFVACCLLLVAHGVWAAFAASGPNRTLVAFAANGGLEPKVTQCYVARE